MSVRPYEARDRAAVRRVCFLTGYMGEPADWFWPDAESFADAFSAWYTDREPQNCFVAELDGRVVGYLLGCAQTSAKRGLVRYGLRHAFRPQAVLRRGVPCFLARVLADLAWDRGAQDGPFLDARWPAHLHINLLPEARGRGLGHALIAAWLERLQGLECPGVHLRTLAENTQAMAFFEREGFARLGPPRPVPGMRTRAGKRVHTLLMVRAIE